MGVTSAVIAAIGVAASVAGQAGAFGSPSTPKMPSPSTTSGAPDTQNLNRALLPGLKANAASNVGGGIAPDYMAGLLDTQTGVPGGGLNVLDDIRKSLGQAGGGLQTP